MAPSMVWGTDTSPSPAFTASDTASARLRWNAECVSTIVIWSVLVAEIATGTVSNASGPDSGGEIGEEFAAAGMLSTEFNC